MKRTIWIPLFVTVGLLAQGCASSQAQRLPVTSVGVRETQTRFFEHTNSADALKAVIDMLQDGQFSIDRTDATLGLVVGTRSNSHIVSGEQKAVKWIAISMSYGLAALLPWGKSETVQIEASVNVTPVGEGSRVRVTLQRRVLDGNGRLKKAEAITDGLLYRDLFEQLDRSVFIADEK